MVKRSKRYKRIVEKVDRKKEYPIEEAVRIIKEFEPAKFDETVEVAVKLGIDPRKSDQNVRGSVNLPHGIGKEIRVICFAEGEAAKAAEEAGAIRVGSEDLAKEIQKGWLDFDVAIASPDMMKYVGKLGRILGPQGKMPSPKAGTVTQNVGRAVAEFKAGKIEFRSDSGANVHVPIGKRSFANDKLVENFEAFMSHLKTLKPAQAKGNFIQKVAICCTMTPSVKVVAR